MSFVLKISTLTLLVAALAGCGGRAVPNFPKQVHDANSLTVSVQVEGADNSALEMVVNYRAKAEGCKYSPQAFGFFPQRSPVPSTNTVLIPGEQDGPSGYVFKVPLPVKDKCGWEVDGLSPTIWLNGTKVTAYTPAMEVESQLYLPQGVVTYHCAIVPPKPSSNRGSFGACRMEPRGDETMKVHLSAK